jgi:hypothetical protein
VDLRTKRGGPSADDINTALYRSGVLRCSLDEVRNTMEKMIAAGSRYKNLEASLGPGVAFVFGKEVSESALAFIMSLDVNLTDRLQIDQIVAEKWQHFRSICAAS